jgi:hypothetical protein
MYPSMAELLSANVIAVFTAAVAASLILFVGYRSTVDGDYRRSVEDADWARDRMEIQNHGAKITCVIGEEIHYRWEHLHELRARVHWLSARLGAPLVALQKTRFSALELMHGSIPNPLASADRNGLTKPQVPQPHPRARPTRETESVPCST